ncbi:hypothetical protein [Mycolicibacterium sp.]
MSDVLRNVHSDTFVESGVRLLTPAVEHFYAVLVRIGVLAIDDATDD